MEEIRLCFFLHHWKHTAVRWTGLRRTDKMTSGRDRQMAETYTEDNT